MAFIQLYEFPLWMIQALLWMIVFLLALFLALISAAQVIAPYLHQQENNLEQTIFLSALAAIHSALETLSFHILYICITYIILLIAMLINMPLIVVIAVVIIIDLIYSADVLNGDNNVGVEFLLRYIN